MALGHGSVAECQRTVSSKEFIEWVAFDSIEPIGSRVTPDLLALLISLFVNVYSKPGTRALLPQDVLADPLAARRLSEQEEAERTGQMAADYRRLRAERLAKMNGTQTGS